MAATMDSPQPYPDSPLDLDEAAYPCKGCGQILEEGKAFELAGNRWHIDCFRCNTCNTLLDSDANLLLLGDGSLICNNCTYSCSNCGNKIEDLAILTGDQAFCANCFKCRNCKKKIENLRYARTSQGIFCMDCHEALMARRRKKTARNTAQRSKLAASSNNSVHLDKSLPAIPPPEARKTAYIPEAEPDAHDVESGPISSPEVSSISRTANDLHNENELDASRRSTASQGQSKEALTLPSTAFRNERQSVTSQRSDMSGGEEFLIPLAFDPTPPTQSPHVSGQVAPRTVEEKPRDYFNPRSSSQAAARLKTASPHIAYQDKARQLSEEDFEPPRQVKEDGASQPGSALASPYFTPEVRPHVSQLARNDVLQSDQFKLQEAPRTKQLANSTRSSKSEASTPRADSAVRSPAQAGSARPSGTGYVTPRETNDPSPVPSDQSPKPAQHPTTSLLTAVPKRGDSLDSAKRSQGVPRKELSAAAVIPQVFSDALSSATPNMKQANLPSDLAKANGGKVISAPIGSPNSKSILDTPNSQLDPDGKGNTDSFTDPRAPPPLPADHSRTRNESVNTFQAGLGEGQRSPALPRYSAGGEFTMDEDMARILGGDEQSAHESFLKRVSNSVRHGRSYSDKSGRMSRDHRWPRSPIVGAAGQDISSPSSASPEHRDELSWFKNELRRERQRTVEREKKIAELEAQLDSTANIKQVNTELKEKRSTIVVLDTQKEIVVRELEILTEHIAAAKKTGEPFDVRKMNSTVLREFAEALEQLKNSFAPQIEELIQRRNDLVDEVANLTQMKDKSLQEFEQLSSKNAQLAELNNQLVHQIQDIYKANAGLSPDPVRSVAPNGLGIYSHQKDKSSFSIDSRDPRNFPSDLSIADSGTTLQAGEAEPITVIQGPQVVNIRKGQAKKFDWRKGQKVAKGVTKGLKGAFSSTQQSYSRELQFAETGAYGQPTVGQEYSSLPRANQEPMRQGFGFFGNQKAGTKSNGLYATQAGTSTPSLLLDASSHLYGSDLEQRAEFEKTSIPGVVKRCVEEVEARGMEVEGIYRKSGGNSQVEQVKSGFERSPTDFDLSDPDLDIHAVTSGLKQYFRKLPTPLITYDVYDRLLETTGIAEGPTQRSRRVESIQRALEGLPRVHYDTLEYLIKHLARVVAHEKENLMTSMNVAVVFAPTIMRPDDLGRELSDTKMKNDVIMWMIEDEDQVFAD